MSGRTSTLSPQNIIEREDVHVRLSVSMSAIDGAGRTSTHAVSGRTSTLPEWEDFHTLIEREDVHALIIEDGRISTPH